MSIPKYLLTRRDMCHFIGRRASRLDLLQAAEAWFFLARHLESLGEKDVPKYLDVVTGIRAATIRAKSAAPWQPIATAPKNATKFEGLTPDGKVLPDVHWASNLSGEEQPPFEGFFVPYFGFEGKCLGYKAAPKMTHWRKKR